MADKLGMQCTEKNSANFHCSTALGLAAVVSDTSRPVRRRRLPRDTLASNMCQVFTPQSWTSSFGGIAIYVDRDVARTPRAPIASSSERELRRLFSVLFIRQVRLKTGQFEANS